MGEGAEDGLRKEALLQHPLTGLLRAAQLHRTISPAPCTDARCSQDFAYTAHKAWQQQSLVSLGYFAHERTPDQRVHQGIHSSTDAKHESGEWNPSLVHSGVL